jgi:hypothetical protein
MKRILLIICVLGVCIGANAQENHAFRKGYRGGEAYTFTTTTYLGDEVQSVSTEEESKEMVHCDFGWSGKCNGYYVSGIFKIDDPNVDRDPDVEFNKDTNYNNLKRLLHIDSYYERVD